MTGGTLALDADGKPTTTRNSARWRALAVLALAQLMVVLDDTRSANNRRTAQSHNLAY